MKNKKIRKKGILALGMACLMTLDSLFVPSLSMTAKAAESKATLKSIILDTTKLVPDDGRWTYGEDKVIYFGNKNGTPIPYRILSNENGKLLMDCDLILEKGYFNSSGAGNAYMGSHMQSYLEGDGYYNGDVFSSIEKNAIASTSYSEFSDYSNFASMATSLFKIDMKVDNNTDTLYPSLNNLYDFPIENQHVFLLSAKDVATYYTMDGNSAGKSLIEDNSVVSEWYIRTALKGTFNNSVCKVQPTTKMYKVKCTDTTGISPAFHLDTSQVFFAMDSAFKKNSLTAVTNTTAQSWKLTLKDSSKKVSMQSGKAASQSGSTITVPYSYSGSGVNQISVMITDKAYTTSGANVLYYGALKTTLQKSGTGTFSLPSNLPSGYKMYIIAEQVNDGAVTDYASTPVEISFSGSVVDPSETEPSETEPSETDPSDPDPSNPEEPDPNQPVLVTKITLNESYVTMNAGSTFTLKATVSPQNATNPAVKYESSYPSVAKVDSKGVITALSVGSTNITCSATDGSKRSASCTVVVTKKVYSVSDNRDKTITQDQAMAFTSNGQLSDFNSVIVDNNEVGSTYYTVEATSEGTKVTLSKTYIAKLSSGKHDIAIQYNDGSAKTTLTIERKVTSIQLSPTSKTLKVGENVTISATVSPSNADNKNLDFSSNNATVASVNSTTGVVTARSKGVAVITCRAMDGSGTNSTCTITVETAETPAPTYTVTSGANQTVTSDQAISFTVDGASTKLSSIAVDGATVSTTNYTKSGTPAVVALNKAYVETLSNGSHTIKFTFSDGSVQTSFSIQRKVTAITLNKTSYSMTIGNTYTLTATVTPSNAANTAVTWKSSNTNVATVSTSGKVTAVAEGSATITCSAADGSGVKATCSITVSQVTYTVTSGANQTVTSDQAISFTVDGASTKLSSIAVDGVTVSTTNYTKSGTPAVVTLNKAYVETLSNGSHTIKFTFSDGSVQTSFSIQRKVTAITLNKTSYSMTIGNTYTLTATVTPSNAANTAVTWKSSNTNVATVSTSGKVTAVAEGSATITCSAADGSGVKATCSITVSKATYNVTGGADQTITSDQAISFTVDGASSKLSSIAVDGTTVSTTNYSKTGTPAVVTLNKAYVQTLSNGDHTIQFIFSDGNAQTSFTIQRKVTAITLNKTSYSMTIGNTYTLTATVTPSNAANTAVTWKSSNTNVATVSTSGKVTAVAEGSATITCSAADGSGVKATCSITVSQVNYNVTSGANQTVTSDQAIGFTVDGASGKLSSIAVDGVTVSTTNYTKSGTPVVVTLNKAYVETLSNGSHTIKFTFSDGSVQTGFTIQRKVTAITLNKSSYGMIIGNTYTLTATVTPSNAANTAVTWKSSNTNVATVSTSGKVTAVAEGTATITCSAADGNGAKATCSITVSKATYNVTSGADQTITSDQAISFTVDSSQANLSSIIVDGKTVESTGYTKIGTPVVVTLNKAYVETLSNGDHTIKFVFSDGSAQSNFTIQRKVTDIMLNTTSHSMIIGKTYTLTTTVSPSNAADTRVNWKSSNTKVATVNDSGKVTAVAEGSTTITCSAADGSDVKATCNITVSKATYNVTDGADQIINADKDVTFTVDGADTSLSSIAIDGTTVNVSNYSKTGAPVVVTLNKAYVAGLPNGRHAIHFNFTDGSVETEFTVDRKVTDITLNKSSYSMIIGKTYTLVATVSPMNAANTAVTWKSTNEAVATVNASGKVTAKATGSATITCSASDGSGVKATCNITVTEATYTVISGANQTVTADKNILFTVDGAAEGLNSIIVDGTKVGTTDYTKSGSIVTVTLTKAYVEGLANGSHTIQFMFSDGSVQAGFTIQRKVTGITLNKSSYTMTIGKTYTLTSTVTPTNAANTSMIWKSSNTTVATVSTLGKVTAVAEGTAIITCSAADGSGVSATCVITVKQATYNVTSGADQTITADQAISFTVDGAATSLTGISIDGQTVSENDYTKSKTPVTVVVKQDYVGDLANGSHTIRFIFNDGSVEARFTVDRQVQSILLNTTSHKMHVNETVTLSADVLPANAANKKVTWKSSNTSVATVSAGKVTGIAEGTATITCSAADGSGVKATCVVTVEKLPPVEYMILEGANQTLTKDQSVVYKTNGNVSKVVSVTVDGMALTQNVDYKTNASTSQITINETCIAGLNNTQYSVMIKFNDGYAMTKLTVKRKVTSVSLDKTSILIDKLKTATLTATVSPSNAANPKVNWSSSDTSVVTVDGGVITGVKKGSAVITCTAADGSGYSASCNVVVSEVPYSILTGNNQLLLEDKAIDFTVSGSLSKLQKVTVDGNKVSENDYDQGDNPVAISLHGAYISGLSNDTHKIAFVFDDGSVETSFKIQRKVKEISLNKTTHSILAGASYTLTATVKPDNAAVQKVSWSSSNTAIATVSTSGKVTGISEGTVVITCTATDGTDIKATCTITVKPVSYTVTAGDRQTISKDQNVEMTVEAPLSKLQRVLVDDAILGTGYYVKTGTSSTVVSIKSDYIATLENGTHTVEFKYSDGNAGASFTITRKVASITLKEKSITITPEESKALSYAVLPEKAANKKVTWSSADPTVAIVDASGQVTGIREGATVITCTAADGSGTKTTCDVKVKAVAYQISEGNNQTVTEDQEIIFKTTGQVSKLKMVIVDGQQLTIGQYVAVASPTVITLNKGYVATLANGTHAIVLEYSDGTVTGSFIIKRKVTSLKLSETSFAMYRDGAKTLSVEVLPSNAANGDVNWKSSNTAVATVDENGKVTAVSTGTTVITCTAADGSGVKATCNVTVEELPPNYYTFAEGANQTITKNGDVKFTINAGSTNFVELKIDGNTVTRTATNYAAMGTPLFVTIKSAYISSLSNGDHEIVFYFRDNYIAKTSLTIQRLVTTVGLNVTTMSVNVGEGKVLTAAISPANAYNKKIEWSSLDPSVATVDDNGRVYGVRPGTATIRCRAKDGSNKYANCVVTVKEIPLTQYEILSGANQTLKTEKSVAIRINMALSTMTGVYMDDKEISSSYYTLDSSTSTVTLTKAYIAKLSNGTHEISVKFKKGYASTKLTIKRKVTGITLNKTKYTMEKGKTFTLKATVAPTNANNKNVTYSTSNKSVATVDSTGKITAKAVGKAVITCTAKDGNGAKATCEITVVQPAPEKGKVYTVGDLKYKVTDNKTDGTGTVTVTAPKSTKSEKITIPKTVKINGYTFKITVIASKAFSDNTKLKTVTINATDLTTIEKEAFKGCSALTKVEISSTKLKKIGSKAFYKCKNLKTIVLKTTKLTDSTVGSDAFNGIKDTCTFDVPNDKIKAYKTLFIKKGAGKKITVK